MNQGTPRKSSATHVQGRLWARWGLDPVRGPIEGISIEWAEGNFVRIEEAPRPPRHFAAAECFGEHLLTPGLLNAHAHLDYSFMRGVLPRGEGFVPWVKALVAARRALRREDEPARREACRAALDELAAGGATEVWDISTFGWARQMLPASGLRALTFEEWIAPRAASWEPAWQAWRARFERESAPLTAATRDRLVAAISPHTAFTVCPPALAAAAAFARRARLPLAIHLGESPEEIELLTRGTGTLRELLREANGADPAADLGAGPSPFQRAEAAGALGPHTLAIHANLPEPEDVRRLQAAGAVVVFCPRAHAFFGYPPWPLKAWRQAHARLALGTDGLTSNESLDMREELRAFAGLAEGWRPLEVLAVATGAALGERPPYGGRGRLEEWKPAQWALWRPAGLPASPTAETLFELLLAPETRLAGSSALFGQE